MTGSDIITWKNRITFWCELFLNFSLRGRKGSQQKSRWIIVTSVTLETEWWLSLTVSSNMAPLCKLWCHHATWHHCITLIAVSATSIFNLPEIQLEKETIRPAVTPDPGNTLTSNTRIYYLCFYFFKCLESKFFKGFSKSDFFSAQRTAHPGGGVFSSDTIMEIVFFWHHQGHQVFLIWLNEVGGVCFFWHHQGGGACLFTSASGRRSLDFVMVRGGWNCLSSGRQLQGKQREPKRKWGSLFFLHRINRK